jgi:cytochrome b subunit of formate dehydrogenase
MSLRVRYLPGLPLLGALVALAIPATLRAQGDCFECHGSADNVGDERLVVQPAGWEATLHGAAGIGCADCHAGKAEYPHESDDPRAACADCHSDAAEALAASIHGQARAAGGKGPECASCHGPLHRLISSADAASPIHPARLPETCGACHSDPELAAAQGIKLVQPIAAYAASVHARGVERGEHAATCSSCHGSHDVLPAADPASRVHPARVPETCGECHGEIESVFAESVHGRAVAQGIHEAPTCVDCHGEHQILGPADKGSPVYASNVPKMTCGRCHGDLRVTEKFGMKSDAVAAFTDSFHGLASRSGSITVANCASCHGVHDILPSTDPKSHIAPANVAATCGACHPGAAASFAIGAVHVLPADKESAHPAVYWVRLVYLWLIWGVIGGMFVHNALDLWRKAQHPMVRPVVPVAERRPRLSRGFRIAHNTNLVAFVMLVWSGFALKYPEASWAAPLLAWEEQLAVRGWLHRGAAILMLLAFAFHFAHVAIDRRARACIFGMMPNLHDWHELKAKLAWFAGRRKEPPTSPPLNYAEKAEYLALVWGTFVMAVTGFVLWFENWSLAHLPAWAADVATVVHFYEAILASLAIVVWHFYAVFLDPLVYPMDTAWLTGREVPGRSLEREASVLEPGAGREEKG